MSESLSNVVYLCIAATAFVMALWKALALLRDATPTLALTVSMQLGGALIYVIASPVGYRTLGEITGRPSFATLPVYVGILVCFAMGHLITLLWDPLLRQKPSGLRHSVIRWSGWYAGGAGLMIVFFALADLSGPADPLRFNTAFADDPMVLLFLAVFLATLTSGTLNTWRQCRTMRLDDPQIQHALRAFAFAMLCVFGYVVCSAPAIALAAVGNHSLDTVGVLGSTCGCIGTVILYYGLSGAAFDAWRRERRDYKALQPLWDLAVARVDQDLALSGGSVHDGRPTMNVSFRLHRRVIEILDGMRALRPWVSAAPMEAVRHLHEHPSRPDWAPLKEQDVPAAATAAALCDAVRRLHAERQEQGGRYTRPGPSGEPPVPLPGDDTPAAQERDRLLRVSGALSHPLVAEALKRTQNTGSATASHQGHGKQRSRDGRDNGRTRPRTRGLQCDEPW
ncbi:MAB_1171c family putative transporter [Streptomyces sp. NPDC093094]|uniref:MAB_1171c family putative transporter n=1 Tax=Streptomyces sp. NPDC093094 TaxID=3366026 RepID=UPI0038023A76